MTDIAHTSPVERIARVITAMALSPNGMGEASAQGTVSAAVDSRVGIEHERAVAILRTLREPTQAMVDAGNAAGGDAANVWSTMVRAALGE